MERLKVQEVFNGKKLEAMDHRFKRRIKVLNMPLTFINIDEDRDPEEAKRNWLAKWNLLHPPFDQFFPKYVSVKKRHRTK